MLSEMYASSLKQRQKTVITSDISITFDILTKSKLFCRINEKILFYENLCLFFFYLNERLTFINRQNAYFKTIKLKIYQA